MDSLSLEDDPRSIQIRKGSKRLVEYFDVLENEKDFYPIEQLDIFDDIFQSFLKEEDYITSFKALKLLFHRIEFYALELANCKIAFNIAQLFDDFLTKFKDQMPEEDKIELKNLVSSLSSNLTDTNYVIALIILKHFEPDLYEKEKNHIISRLENIEGADKCIKTLIESIYAYPLQELNDLIYFQLRSFVLIKNSMILTEDYIKESSDKLYSEDYDETWIAIYANKMLSNLIIPIIAKKQDKIKGDEIEMKERVLLIWLLDFAKKAFGKKTRPDKWESVNEEDFLKTWQFVKEHAKPKSLRNFCTYLINNGFDFHLGDPFTETCYN